MIVLECEPWNHRTNIRPMMKMRSNNDEATEIGLLPQPTPHELKKKERKKKKGGALQINGRPSALML